MPTYRQISTFEENGYGTVTVLFVVSDACDALFATSGQIDTGVFLLESASTDLDIKEGVLVEDELKFKALGQAVESQADEDALAFVLAARDKDMRRFCAVFLMPADTDAPQLDELLFSGMIRPEMKANDLHWYGAEWDDDPAPVREWDLSAGVFFANSFDAIPVKDLIVGNPSEGVPGIPPSFEASDVFDRLGYYKDVAANREMRYVAITDLNSVLRGLLGNLVTALQAKGYGSYSVEFMESPLGADFLPVHYGYYSSMSGATHYVYVNGQSTQATYIGIGAKELALGDSLEPYHVFVSYTLFKPKWVESPQGSDEDGYCWQDFESMTELLYAIAATFGCYLKYWWTSPSDLKIKLLSRKDVRAHRVWLKDATSAELDLNPLDDEDRIYYAQPFALAKDESDVYAFHTDGKIYKNYTFPNGIKPPAKGDRLPLSVAPTRRVIARFAEGYEHPQLPHNVLMYEAGSPVSPRVEWKDTKGFTNAIYMQTVGDTEHGLNGTTIIAPVGRIDAVINGTPTIFFSIADYVNTLLNRDKDYYEAEYGIEVPYLCGWRKSADGSHPDDDGGRGNWKNLQHGCTIELDGIEWIVVGIERSLSSPSVKLRLHYASRFAIETGANQPAYAVTPPSVQSQIPTGVSEHTAGSVILAGDYVTMQTSGEVIKSYASAGHYPGLYGVAVTTATESGTVLVKTSGEVSSDRYSLEPGKPVFVRTSVNCNLSAVPLTAPIDGENLYARVGVALTETSFILETPRKIILMEIPT